jgi:PKD repeat protein
MKSNANNMIVMRSKLIQSIFISTLSLFLISSGTTFVVSADETYLVDASLTPSTHTVGIGGTFTVDIYIEPETDINVVNLENLTFSAPLLSVTASKGDLFDNTVLEWPGPAFSINNDTGVIEELLWATSIPTSDAGTFCHLHFTAHSPGTAYVNISKINAAFGETIYPIDILTNCTVLIEGSDTTAPEIEQVNAIPDEILENNPVNISCQVTDNILVNEVTVNVTYPDGMTFINESMSHILPDIYYYNRTYTVPGDYTFYIWACDASGNYNESPVYDFQIIDNQNESPEAYDDYYTTFEDITLNIASPGILANDTDVEDDPLTAIKVTNPTHGSITEFNTDGSFTYVPEANFCGSDSFTYKVNDGFSYSNIATVHITINCINDLPVADFTYSPDSPILTDTIDFTDNSNDIDGNIANWTWDFGDGNISYLQNPQHQYATEGRYDVNLTVKDDNDAVSNIIKTITIREVPRQVLSITLTRPSEKHFYFKDISGKTNPMNTLIIGKITIKAKVENAIGPVTVEYYIDDDYKANSTEQPYEWLWNERAFGKHTIKVVVRDSTGETDSDSLDVRIFNFALFKNRTPRLILKK